MTVPSAWEETLLMLDTSLDVDLKTTIHSRADYDSFERAQHSGGNNAQSDETEITQDFHAAHSIAESALPLRSLGQEDDADYILDSVLGTGGMGVVYAARQRSLHRDLALKVQLDPSPIYSREGQRFFSEALVTGALSHPNIVPVVEIGVSDDQALFYAMHKVGGESWHRVIQKEKDFGIFNLEYHMHILEHVSQAMACAHQSGVLHCDLKPANVMVDKQDHVFVVDWGLAMRRSVVVDSADGTGNTNSTSNANSTENDGSVARYMPLTPGGFGGTPAYMAPEQAAHDIKSLCPATDIYLLGAILHELCTGRPPHTATNIHKCLDAAMNNVIDSSVDAHPLLPIAYRAMASAVSDRYADVQEFIGAL